MENKENQTFTGERAQYFAENVSYKNCIFVDGESPLKHAKDISLEKCEFRYKYPLWNTENVKISSSRFYELGKSGIWYAQNMMIEDTVIDAPKEFRRCSGITLKNVDFNNAAETFWSCDKISLENVNAKGDYFAMNSSNLIAKNFNLDGNYFFDGGKNCEVHNSRLISKDAFWNCENVTVYDSYINGEYLGWNSKNLKFVNCTIESDQGLCYIDGLKMQNCTLVNTVLSFEYSKNLDVEIKGRIDSIKNPGCGCIKVDEIGTLILNPKRCDPSKIKIECSKIDKTLSEDTNPNEK